MSLNAVYLDEDPAVEAAQVEQTVGGSLVTRSLGGLVLRRVRVRPKTSVIRRGVQRISE